MNIAIVDDEENIRNLYKKYCEEWANNNKIDLKTELFTSGENFIFNYDENDYIDILLLDVEMKKLMAWNYPREFVRKIPIFRLFS